MWGWGKPHPYIFMIKNLITASILATSIGINNTQANIQNNNEYQGTTNTYNETFYDANDILIIENRLKIIEYKNAILGSNITIKARAIQEYSRSLDGNDSEYTIIQNTYIELDIRNNIDWTTDVITFGLFFDTSLLSNTKVDYFYFETMTQTQRNFIDGANYNNYQELSQVNYDMSNNREIGNLNIQGTNGAYLINNTHYFCEIHQEFYFDETKITDDGLSLYTFNPYSNSLNHNIYYNLPSNTNYEVVDIPGMMFAILGMPFAWLSTAFNFTIFPNTPYAINISAILMAIVISLIALYIIKRILK